MSSAIISTLQTGIIETLYMTLVTMVISYIFGLPLGVLLFITDKDSLVPKYSLNKLLGIVVNIIRSIPFLILLMLLLPVTRVIVGTTIGPTATIVPLVFSATPFIARVVESSLKEVNAGVIEAAQSMGANNLQLITKVLLPEARPSLAVNAVIALTTVLGYSAMAGIVGGGGLGAIAINYGFYRYNSEVMLVTVALLVIIVQIFQEAGMKIATKIDRRRK